MRHSTQEALEFTDTHRADQDQLTIPDALEGARHVHTGWDGRSRPMIDLEQPCGCRWTRDGKARLRVCTTCLTAAIHRDAR